MPECHGVKQYATAFLIVAAICWTCSVWAMRPAKLSAVISIEDLEAEIKAKVSEIESSLATPDSFQQTSRQRHLATTQLAVFSQSLLEHDDAATLKSSGRALRDVAMKIDRCRTFHDSGELLGELRTAAAVNAFAHEPSDFDWSHLARNRSLMDSLRDRTDQIRKALRRSKDPLVESRHASAMAVLGLAVAAHASQVKQASDQSLWSEWSLEFQREMTSTAAAIRQRDSAASLAHFKAAQSVCDKCHDRFKP